MMGLAIGLIDPTEGILTSMIIGGSIGGVTNLWGQIAVNSLPGRGGELQINRGSLIGSVFGGALGGGMGNVAKTGILAGAGPIISDIGAAAAGATQSTMWPLIGANFP